MITLGRLPSAYHANFGFNSLVGASPHMGEILLLCDCFDCPVLSFFSRERAQNSNKAAVHFLKLEVVLSQQWIEISHQNLVCE